MFYITHGIGLKTAHMSIRAAALACGPGQTDSLVVVVEGWQSG
jgi:hypothetical protein